MSIKTIMSACSPDQSDDDIRAVAQLCSEADAHLTLVVMAVAPAMPTGEYAAEMSLEWQEIRQADLDRIAAKAAQVRHILEQSGISFAVETEYAERGYLDDAMGLRARYCDLVYLSRNLLKDGAAAESVFEGCLFQSARPILVMPPGLVPNLKPKKVLIAWDSRAEAARAVYSALGILASSEEVSVAIVDPIASEAYNGAEPGADVASYLARHGLRVTVEQLSSGGRPIADILKQHATDIAADLLVMGAYGHSRLRERIFGGVTRAFKEDATLPVLIAH